MQMFGNIVRIVSGPLGMAVGVAELVIVVGKVADALLDDDEEDEA
jgi:hypothetical protein